MREFSVSSLDANTWHLFAELVERNNGIYGGCWCIGFHPECGQKDISHRTVKEDRVKSGRAHHALVLDRDGAAQGWCQWGDVEKLSNIKHKREYEKTSPPVPDWRITCIFVDKKHRGQGIARVAVEGALRQIADHGAVWSKQSRRSLLVGNHRGDSCLVGRRNSLRTTGLRAGVRWASTLGFIASTLRPHCVVSQPQHRLICFYDSGSVGARRNTLPPIAIT